jgi:26S proteasome regulatory subunit N1
MGKGTIGVNPFHTDRSLMSPVAVCGLLSTLIAFTDIRGFILDKSHWMLYFLTMAMYPVSSSDYLSFAFELAELTLPSVPLELKRFLITFDESGELLPATVRVGQAVDVVGQAGKPRTISGFQTHQTPVRLGHRERAEMATEEYLPYSHVLEGYVVLAKNKGFEEEEMETDK